MPARRASKRPPKGFMDRCIAGVKRSYRRLKRKARDPGALCGNTWYNVMTDASRRKAKQKYRN